MTSRPPSRALRLALFAALFAAPLGAAPPAEDKVGPPVEQCVDLNASGGIDAGDAVRLLGVAVGAEAPEDLPMCGVEGITRTVMYAGNLVEGSYNSTLVCDGVGYRGAEPFELSFVTDFIPIFDGATEGTNLMLAGDEGFVSPFVTPLNREVVVPLVLDFQFSVTGVASNGMGFSFDVAPVSISLEGQTAVDDLPGGVTGAIKFECSSGDTPPEPVPGKADEIVAPLACIFSVIDDSIPGVPIQLCSFDVAPGRFVIPGLPVRASAALNP